MFGMGMWELVLIAIVALLALGPEKLPQAAKTLSKGIRDFRKQTRELQDTLEDDHEIGDAIRDLKSALRGEDIAPQIRQRQQQREAARAAKQASANLHSSSESGTQAGDQTAGGQAAEMDADGQRRDGDPAHEAVEANVPMMWPGYAGPSPGSGSSGGDASEPVIKPAPGAVAQGGLAESSPPADSDSVFTPPRADLSGSASTAASSEVDSAGGAVATSAEADAPSESGHDKAHG